MAFLAGLVGQTQCMLVKDLADFKLYVINNLVKVIESTDNPKEKTTALRALGEVDGVDVFKKKTEVTHKLETMEEVEKELLSMLNEFKAKGLMKPPAETIDAEVIEVKDE
jgi:CHAD domain-containing protein